MARPGRARPGVAGGADGKRRVMLKLIQGDCLEVLPTLADASVDAVVTDPPYPEIDRAYGRLSEASWGTMMRAVVGEARRILKPAGSAVFVLQPNSERVGRMRTWLWEFQAWLGASWGIVQDAYWWNYTTPPNVHCQRSRGLMRPSVKLCVWAGPPDCYRNQSAVLWTESEASAAQDRSKRALKVSPSGLSTRGGRTYAAADERGGVTPFNLLPLANTTPATAHGATTPLELCAWWIRYLCPPGGSVLDPFSGSGTVGLAALRNGCGFIGVERDTAYFEIARRRLNADAGLLAYAAEGGA